MATLQFLNAFISERLTAAAVEIFGAVEKTLIEYQGEISRSKEEIDHLRTLVLWPEVKLHRAAHHQVITPGCDEELPPGQHHSEEEWGPNVSQEHPNTLHIKEEHDPRADQHGSSSRQKSDAVTCSPFVKRECHQDSPPPLHLYRILTVEHSAISTTEDIKAEPDGDGFVTSPSTRRAETPCGVNPECSGVQRETLQGPLEVTHREEDRSPEQQYGERDWSPSQDQEDPDPPQIKEEKFTSSGPEEESDNDCKLPLQSETSVYDEPHSSSPGQDPTLRYRTFYITEEMTRDADGEGYELSGATRASRPIYSVNPDYAAAHCEYGENAEGVENGEWLQAFTPKGTRTTKRQNSNLCTEGREGIGAEGDVNDLTRERRHTCPICRKRFKESSHLRDHVRIHTGEKPFQCKECGMNFRQSGALTLHMRTHTGERPYQCSDCGRRFNRKGDMETHRVTHTGERPHQCMACGKSFRRKSNLNTHLKTHTEEKMDYTEPL
ncbi:uncharacterized protein [Centroberyx affinis]|uniref:uncharacterized protein n=1 Tax=Centroberyx affinis TaxID=166261 RepID=UPI003A5C1209